MHHPLPALAFTGAATCSAAAATCWMLVIAVRLARQPSTAAGLGDPPIPLAGRPRFAFLACAAAFVWAIAGFIVIADIAGVLQWPNAAAALSGGIGTGAAVLGLNLRRWPKAPDAPPAERILASVKTSRFAMYGMGAFVLAFAFTMIIKAVDHNLPQ